MKAFKKDIAKIDSLCRKKQYTFLPGRGVRYDSEIPFRHR